MGLKIVYLSIHALNNPERFIGSKSPTSPSLCQVGLIFKNIYIFDRIASAKKANT